MKKDKRGYYRETGSYRGELYDFRAKSKEALRDKVQHFMDQIDKGIVSPDMTVESWAKYWMETYKQRTVSAKQLATYQGIINNYVAPAIGRRRLQDIRSVELQAILNNLDCSRDYGAKIMQTIKQLFRTARQNKLISDDPAEFLQLPKLRSGTRRSITDAERTLILRACEDHKAGNWVLMMLYCGLRPSEAAALRWIDIDIPNRVVHVTHAIDRYSGAVKEPKTSSGVRDIPLTEELVRQLRPGKPFEFITTNSQGRIHTDQSLNNLWKSFKRHMDKIGGAKFYRNKVVISAVADDLTPYCLRHTYCTDLQAAGVPINVAKELMGHSDISVTSRIYTHKSNASTRDALDRLNTMQSRANLSVGTSGTNTGTK